jgi:hypothetical protein
MEYPIKIVQQDGLPFIWDGIRKKYVKLNPEEIVRQQCIQFLIEQCNYPKASISVEKKIKIGDRNLRYDIIIYKQAKPWMIVECKAESILIDESIFMQSLVYHQQLQANFILLTNGVQTICYDVMLQCWLSEIVAWE